MKKNFIILPHQLFDKKYLKKMKNEYKFYLYEHPHYFKSYNYNKKKLLLHFSSMLYYYDYLKNAKFDIKYIKYNEKLPINKYILFDPIDKIKLSGKYEILETPNFLVGNELMGKYREKTDKYLFNNFYMWCKKELNIIPKIKSKDKDNRRKLPKNIEIPNVPSNQKNNDDYINISKSRVEKEFNKNYGNIENFIFPCTHLTVRNWLKDFIKNRFKKFGDYQDAIDKNNDYLFHSLLSTSINIGLLNPIEIIDEIEKHKSKIPINSYEGFIRQLFWREYQKYCYKYYDFKNKNYFGNNKKLDKRWYEGNLNIPPVDDAIKAAFENGYLHHIQRLMVIGNYMNLSEINPEEGFRWFMEFSCDSYEWVMHQNVLDMVFFVSGGDTMRRPYSSTSNYILNMSNYSKGEWCDKWDNLYYKFLKKNKKKLYKFRYFFRGLDKV